MLKSIFENNIKINLASQAFLVWSCSIIFVSSIYLRSIIDIGADTAIYINIAEKITKGGRYYYDFYESNFPISFWYYALQYKIAQFLKISPIILSEIFVNILALGSIIWSAKILKKSTIHEDKVAYNLVIISYFLGFFLRPIAVSIGEFGTKTSLVLILFYPYLSYSFFRLSSFSRKELVLRGITMGLIPCVKPHYLALILFIEIYLFFKRTSSSYLKYFIELDKLIMLFVGSFYLILMMKFTPEFFEFMVPMWSKTYPSYDRPELFIDNTIRNIASYFAVFGLITLIFSRVKADKNDVILLLAFVGVSVVIILESSSNIDQVGLFYVIATICFIKFSYNLLTSENFSISKNKFIIGALILLPAFDIENLPISFLGLGGIINIWWLFALTYPFYLRKKYSSQFSNKQMVIFFIFYFLCLGIAIYLLRNIGSWAYVGFNMIALLIFLFLFESQIYKKISDSFSAFSTFIIMTSISCLLYAYISSVVAIIVRDETRIIPFRVFDFVAYYSKVYMPDEEDGIIAIASVNNNIHPLSTYLQRKIYQKFHVVPISSTNSKTGSSLIINIDNKDRVFAQSYLIDDAIEGIENKNTKVILVNHKNHLFYGDRSCYINALEYYFLSPKFKKIFQDNFRFENRLLLSKKVSGYTTSNEENVESSNIEWDFEVYIRKNE